MEHLLSIILFISRQTVAVEKIFERKVFFFLHNSQGWSPIYRSFCHWGWGVRISTFVIIFNFGQHTLGFIEDFGVPTKHIPCRDFQQGKKRARNFHNSKKLGALESSALDPCFPSLIIVAILFPHRNTNFSSSTLQSAIIPGQVGFGRSIKLFSSSLNLS